MFQKLRVMSKSFYKVVKILVLAAAMLPISGQATEQQTPAWVCDQIGYWEDSGAYVISNVFFTKVDYKKTVKYFETSVEDQYKTYQPGYMARCWEFPNQKKAEKFIDDRLDTAVKRKFQILPVYLGDLR